MKECADGPETSVKILKSDPEALADPVMPDIVPPAGLTEQRENYLFRMVRPFVKDPFKDITCPNPEE